MRSTGSNTLRPARLLSSAALLIVIAAATTGCQTMQTAETTGATPAAAGDQSTGDVRRDVEVFGQQYRADPSNVDVAIRYAQALRKTGQRAQAVAILEKASIESPHNKTLLGAYGRALAEAGNYDQALQVLDRAHTPDQPDWHILSAQGAVLDQMGRHAEAQRYYLTALKIVPDEPSVLSNLGLSYALSKNCPRPRRRCAAPRRVRRSISGCGRISRLWSACKAALAKPRASPAPICRPTKPPPMSPICGRCSRTAKICASRAAPRTPRLAPADCSSLTATGSPSL